MEKVKKVTHFVHTLEKETKKQKRHTVILKNSKNIHIEKTSIPIACLRLADTPDSPSFRANRSTSQATYFAYLIYCLAFAKLAALFAHPPPGVAANVASINPLFAISDATIHHRSLGSACNH